VYRQTWERLAARLSEREACKTIVGLLVLAAAGHEAQLATELEQLIELDQLPAYFRPWRTAFQSEGGHDFKLIADSVSDDRGHRFKVKADSISS
jgi:hypothetical protein